MILIILIIVIIIAIVLIVTAIPFEITFAIFLIGSGNKISVEKCWVVWLIEAKLFSELRELIFVHVYLSSYDWLFVINAQYSYFSSWFGGSTLAIGWCPNRLYARAAIWPMVTCTNHIGWKLMIISLHGDEGWYKEEQTNGESDDELIMWQRQRTGHLCWPRRLHDQTLTISGGNFWGKIFDFQMGKFDSWV